MDVKTKLRPGENSTKGLLKQYGEQLVCVRYRYDKARQNRHKTVELIIDEKDCIPGILIAPEKRVFLRIDYGETELRELVKRSGGYWNPHRKAWSLTFGKALALGLEQRVLDEALDL
jgi:hypothetical protein